MSGGTAVSRAVLLAGGPTPAPLAVSTGLSRLDLHVTADHSVLEHWLDRIERLGEWLSTGFEVRVIYDGHSPRPSDPVLKRPFVVRIEEESGRYRGAAGLVRDACADLLDEGTVLVIEAGRYLAGTLDGLVASHGSSGAEVTVAVNPDASPAGVYLLDRSTLNLVPKVGFTDLKEQWLQSVLSRGLEVQAHRLREPGCLGLRTREQFLAAAAIAGPMVSGGSVVSTGAEVSDSAALVDSVVMPGARVGARAVVARSVLCPGAVVERDAEVLDAAFGARKV